MLGRVRTRGAVDEERVVPPVDEEAEGVAQLARRVLEQQPREPEEPQRVEHLAHEHLRGRRRIDPQARICARVAHVRNGTTR